MFNPWSITDIPSAKIEVLDPFNKAKTGIFVIMAGPEHEGAKAFAFVRERERRNILARTGRLQLPDPTQDAPMSVDELVNATLGWENMPGPDGRPFEFAAENVRKLYTERPWFRDQMADGRRERANFLLRSEAT